MNSNATIAPVATNITSFAFKFRNTYGIFESVERWRSLDKSATLLPAFGLHQFQTAIVGGESGVIVDNDSGEGQPSSICFSASGFAIKLPQSVMN